MNRSPGAWFGPESFAAVVLGMVCISLPYVGLAPREAGWLILAPLGLGGAALAAGIGMNQTALRRIGAGLLAAFAGFLLMLIGFLIGIGIGHLFQ
ncbi:hypothetical protein [Nocardia sp. NPDC052566]|uniref:hypothetical protein n=1 Tax=Nocardia sp. NPDC052566 TaxID=3364330 RepID=UPI0037CA188B